MIYRNLSIAAGGGIIAHNQQSAQEECANVFIGLGGTGISCLREVKAQVYNRLKPDVEKADIPQYKHIQFLAIDADEGSLGDDGSINTLDSVTEFVNISSSDIHAIIRNTKVLRQNPALQWFSDEISIQNAEAGAGGVRQIGRLLVIQNVDKIVNALSNKIDLARTDLSDRPINIHIFTGMGGGTGSGCFLDICYILKHVLESKSIHGQAQTSGYFFLPDVNLAKINTETVRKYIEINGFAAMKELDYCMNFHNNGGKWTQNYGSFQTNFPDPPVKLAYLISAKDDNGNIKTNGYNYAMNVVAEYVMEFMTRELVSDDIRKNGDFGLKSHISNFNNTVAMLKKRRGVTYEYCVLGAASAFMPFKDINTYLSARIFEDLEKMPRSNHDINTFVNDNGLRYEDILNEIKKGSRSVPIYEVDPKLLKEQCEGISSDVIPQVLMQIRDVIPVIEGEYTKNCEGLRQNLINSVYQKLLQYSTSFEKGPFYAALVLYTNNKTDRDLGHVIDGYIARNDKDMALARGDLTLRSKDMAAALRDVQNRRAKSKRASAYVSSVHAYCNQLAKIALLRVMGDLLNSLRPAVTKLYNDRFAPLLEMLNNLSQTFRANIRALAESPSDSGDYAVKITGLEDEELKEALEASVDKLDTESILTGFISYMMDESRSKLWIGRSNEERLSNIISEYFVNALSSITNKNIDEYLASKFQSDSPALISKAVYTHIMFNLSRRARPLFWADKSEGGISQDSKIGYVSIPDTSDIIAAAADELVVADNKLTVRKSLMPDRISVLIFYCGIPMYLFKGSYNYKPKYLSNPIKGLHIYEGNGYDQRDFRKLHDIIPLSMISDDEFSDQMRSFERDYRKAVEYGIIFRESVDNEGKSYRYLLRTVDKKEAEELAFRIDKALYEKNPERMRKLYDMTEKSPSFIGYVKLPLIGTDGYEESSVEDAVYASEKLRGLMAEQLSAAAAREQKLKALFAAINSDAEWRDEIDSFANALCTGVICFKNRYTINYLKDEGGLTDEYELTGIDNKPYGEYIPLYSAFKEYRALDREDKEYIGNLSRQRKLSEIDICKRYTDSIKKYIDEKIDIIFEIADHSFRLERKEIHIFIATLQKLVDTLSRTII
jgi:hypothetical protein